MEYDIKRINIDWENDRLKEVSDTSLVWLKTLVIHYMDKGWTPVGLPQAVWKPAVRTRGIEQPDSNCIMWVQLMSKPKKKGKT